jgi:hypothetical protein
VNPTLATGGLSGSGALPGGRPCCTTHWRWSPVSRPSMPRHLGAERFAALKELLAELLSHADPTAPSAPTDHRYRAIRPAGPYARQSDWTCPPAASHHRTQPAHPATEGSITACARVRRWQF